MPVAARPSRDRLTSCPARATQRRSRGAALGTTIRGDAVDAHGLAELVAVELHGLRRGRRDLDAGAAGVAHGVVLRAQREHLAAGAEAAQHAVVPRDAAPDEEPAERTLRLEDDDVEQAVGDGCLGDELEPGRQRPAVREQHALHARGVQAVPVELVHDAERLGVRQRPRRAVDVGDPADRLLEVAARVGDHRGVEPDAAHHDERVLLGRAVGAAERRRSRRRSGCVSPSKVARTIASASSSGRSRLRASRLPVPLGTIVSGTPLPLIASDDRAHRAVAAGDEHRVDALRQRLAGDVVAEIVDGRLVEERLGPSGLRRQPRRPSARRASASTLMGL